MALPNPTLDDKRFDEFVEDARALIPRFAPAWTDHNLHDPGMTFIDLFAWLADLQVYQLNRVTAANRERFLKLVGLTPLPVQPARVSVQFDSIAADESVFLPAGTRMRPGGREAPIFETQEDFYLTPAKLVSIKSEFGDKVFDHRNANDQPGIFFSPFTPQAENAAGSANTGLAHATLILGFDRPFAAEEPVHLTVRLFEADLPAVVALDDASVEIPAPVSLKWEYWSTAGSWQPLDLTRDSTRQLTQNGAVHFRAPADLGSDSEGQIAIRTFIENGDYEITPRIDEITLNTLPALQIETVVDEMLGVSDGTPDQRFLLKKSPVLPAQNGERAFSIQVQADDETWRDWLEVDDFEDFGPADEVFVFHASDGAIVFGNGLNGAIPESGQTIRAHSYRTSQGEAGNVAAGGRWLIDNSGISGKNVRAATGGLPAESLDDAEKRARKDLNERFRAITSADFENLARNTPGVRVARAKALTNYRPNLPHLQVPGSVTVVVVPYTRGRSQTPAPSAAFLQTVRAHLERHRLLTTDLYVIAPDYVRISVTCKIFPKRRSDANEVVRRVQARLRAFLDPLGEGGPHENGWPFGRPVFPAELYQIIDKVEGVNYLTGLEIQAEGNARKRNGIVEILPLGLVFSGAHQIEVGEVK